MMRAAIQFQGFLFEGCIHSFSVLQCVLRDLYMIYLVQFLLIPWRAVVTRYHALLYICIYIYIQVYEYTCNVR